ncbi:MAG: ornithine cyclodeaminase [Planctomycetaceae bacterium]|nr:ornithine cyclodeaminase [Planctomycetaceae bacterium]
MLYLRESDVEQLLDMPTTLEVVEEAFRQLSAGNADNVPRQRAKATGILLHSMSAAADYLGLVGWKQYTTTHSGAKFHIGLYDQASGELIALIAADRLGQMRTGAVTGVAAKYLASINATKVGLFGSGWQAESQLEAVAAARPIGQAFVYSRHPERRQAFASKMSEKLNLQVTAVDEPRQAVEGLPIVITATTSREPVFDGEWLSDGSLVCAIGSNWLNKAEIDLATIRRGKLVVCDSVECCRHEAGDFVPALEQGVFRWEDAVELGDVVSSSNAARDQEGITVFKSVGMAIEDVAVAAKVVELAKDAGLGLPSVCVV